MEAFGTVLIVIAIVGAVVAILSYRGVGRVYDVLGRGDLSLDEPELRPSPTPGSAAWQAEATAELRQLLEAKSDRATARGEPPLDVEAEIARLSDQTHDVDPGLREEVRELVAATNERRARRRLPALNVEDEVDRRLRDAHG